jgi:UDP-N-acetylmuramate dehydrogenase
MKIQENVSLKEYNTFGIDKKAHFFIQAREIQDIREAITWSRTQNLPLFVLGGGSNVLFTHDLDAVVLKVDIQGISIIRESGEHVWLKAGAGVVWQELVDHAIKKGWSGIENLSWIPGTVGASPMQNIGAYGVEIREVFDHLTAVNRETLQTETFDNEACCFGYRESVFKNHLKDKYIISYVVLKLNKQHRFNTSYGDIQKTLEELGYAPDIQSISEAVIRIRQKKLPDPKAIGNAGSFFKNPTLSQETFDRLKRRFPDILQQTG